MNEAYFFGVMVARKGNNSAQGERGEATKHHNLELLFQGLGEFMGSVLGIIQSGNSTRTLFIILLALGKSLG